MDAAARRPRSAARSTRYRLALGGQPGRERLAMWRRPAAPGCAALAIAARDMAPTRGARLRRAGDRR
ncbi:hypothetical protein L839_3031 [Mycobacterium avium MAV_120809_2495]|nr:hypothetical protein L839_3031 [Mycobacterium avium MAV_120809_2495]